VAQALACFERTVVGGSSKFDGFLKGNTAALSDEALLGMDLFRRDARCINCHNGPAFSDGGFHDLGLSNYGRPFEDLGRGKITNDPTDTGKFRTPSLRDATATQPLMHNGLFELPVALMLYNAGMPTPQRKESQADDPRFPVKSQLLKPLGLNKQDLADLTAFLTSLEEPKRRIRPPEIPGLHPAPQGPQSAKADRP
jgi:cytochrome c peroxidase